MEILVVVAVATLVGVIALRDVPNYKAHYDDAVEKFNKRGLDFIPWHDMPKSWGFSIFHYGIPSLFGALRLLWYKRDLDVRGYIAIPTPVNRVSAEWIRGVVETEENPDKTEPGWILFRKDVSRGYFGQSWKQQSRLAGKAGEVVLNVAEVVWALRVYRYARQERLCEDFFVRTRSIGPNGQHLVVGLFSEEFGIVVDEMSDDGHEKVGLATGHLFLS